MKRKRFWKNTFFQKAFSAVCLLGMLLFLAKAPVWAAPQEMDAPSEENTAQLYKEYGKRLDGIRKRADIVESGFQVVRWQMFPVWLENLGEVTFIPAMDTEYHRLALFFCGCRRRYCI